jgi:hypothetical protein
MDLRIGEFRLSPLRDPGHRILRSSRGRPCDVALDGSHVLPSLELPRASPWVLPNNEPTPSTILLGDSRSRCSMYKDRTFPLGKRRIQESRRGARSFRLEYFRSTSDSS